MTSTFRNVLCRSSVIVSVALQTRRLDLVLLLFILIGLIIVEAQRDFELRISKGYPRILD